jgi:hypothetical protein
LLIASYITIRGAKNCKQVTAGDETMEAKVASDKPLKAISWRRWSGESEAGSCKVDMIMMMKLVGDDDDM